MLWLPIRDGWAYDKDTKFKFGDYAIWLQAILTPCAIGIAALTVFLQWRSLQETLQEQRLSNAQQSELNKNVLLGVMFDNMERFQNHLNYMTCAAVFNERRSRDVVEKMGPMGYINSVLFDGLKIEIGPEYQKLITDLENIISMAEASGTLPFFDLRILQLHERLKELRSHLAQGS